VLVQPTGYGFDNACLLDALAQLGKEAIGAAVVPAEVSDSELQRLHAGGVRGVRYMMLGGSGGLLPWDTLEAMAARIAPLGWHINLQFDGREMPQRKELIDRLPGTVLIDHVGRFVEPVAVHDPAFKALQSVLERDRRWVKLSAPYETSKSGPPLYDDVSALARALVRSHPQRCLWASNWPHPNRVPRPADADVLALLSNWAPDAAVRRRRSKPPFVVGMRSGARGRSARATCPVWAIPFLTAWTEPRGPRGRACSIDWWWIFIPP